ncbi:hypothetical protein GCM10009811_18290 [Nostocoides veronense]|uniref:Nucleoside triphosphate pyrophosphatase n=1 Tax=Nostocoides veronense TaxID=330836 RepID=A0ABP4XW76_9MICO
MSGLSGTGGSLVVLGSGSKTRLKVLRAAGLEPEIVIPGVDEGAIRDSAWALPTSEVVTLIAQAKVGAALAQLVPPFPGPIMVVSCDTIMEIDGRRLEKARTFEQAVAHLRELSGRTARVTTGQVTAVSPSGSLGDTVHVEATAHCDLVLDEFSEREIVSWAESGEPQTAAGCAIDALGGAFVLDVRGDPWAVSGVSLSLLRRAATQVGLSWPDFWNRGSWLVA